MQSTSLHWAEGDVNGATRDRTCAWCDWELVSWLLGQVAACRLATLCAKGRAMHGKRTHLHVGGSSCSRLAEGTGVQEKGAALA